MRRTLKKKTIPVFPQEIKRKRDYWHWRGMVKAGKEHQDVKPEKILTWLRKHKIIQ